MSLMCRKSNSLTVTRVFSEGKMKKFDSRISIQRIESKSCVRKLSCNGSESDGEYETSSEGRLLPGPETDPSRCGTRKSASASTSSEAKVSIENFEMGRGRRRRGSSGRIVNKKSNTEMRGFVNTIKSVTELRETMVQSVGKRDESLLASNFLFDTDKRTLCLQSDSCKTLQSKCTESNFVLSTTTKYSSTDVESVYRERKFHSDTYSCSLEADSLKDINERDEKNRLKFRHDNQMIREGKDDDHIDLGK